MKRILTTLFISFAFLTTVFAADQKPPLPVDSCKAQVPYGIPTGNKANTIICRTGYILEHDGNAKIPLWVSWTLTPDHAIGCSVRSNAFATDQSLPEGKRSEPKDYVGSGYDQGHLANDGDQSWSDATEHESFYMSNMSPQLPPVNRGTWKSLESATRAWVHQTNHPHTVYAGNIWSAKSKTIGKNKVIVPDYLFKIVIDNTTKKSYAFIMPNIDKIKPDFTDYQVTVKDVEKASGVTFNVPDSKDSKNKSIEADLKSVLNDKRAECKK